ncbi:Tubulin delta chain [Tetrabaena socialis]|uniref:Tubulin delta chain n=1 Tax=Tetrabaena socialis TaxID=47790 RepID=A0A2J7ZXP9_9CHLO|nr:Tubulin delta chain [Tetrabaena socialis]|eukprot:PNH05043.1 Tubulin delta chain [Tetrabaena socialis]
MPVITLQLGQCGNQLGYSFFSALASELSASDYGAEAVHEYFRPGPDASTFTARSVLIDMEPKVVAGSCAAAEASGGWWRYPPGGCLVMQSGSGNNWAQGFHGYGPTVHEAALELVRREVEAADSLTGFLLLQSMAGGTGAGLGTYVAQALRDEYHSAIITNCCVWPYESGEVIVQPYNTLLTLSHLADLSDGCVLLENEALHRTAAKLMGIARPTFGDINTIAARALASLLLPSQTRKPGSGAPQGQGQGQGQGPHGRGAPGAAGGGGPGQLPALRRTGSGSGSSPGSAAGAPPPGPPAGGGRPPPCSTSPLLDLVTHLCPHPAYRLLTLRAIPQLPPASIDFTTFTWPAILKRLRQMLITGSVLEEGMDWSVTSNSPGAGQPTYASAQAGGGGGARSNRAVASWLVLRGQGAADVDASDFADPALHTPWAVDPLAVSYSAHKFGRCLMSASLLSNDRRCVGPIQRMQEHAYGMLASRAYVHQYEKYGMGVSDFEACFARIEDIAQHYSML